MSKKIKVTTSHSYLPSEVIFFNILNRLPVKSLHRFCSVSKLWYETIHDPEFVRSLLVQDRENTRSSLVALFQVKNMDQKQRVFDYIFAHKGLEIFRIHTEKWTCIIGDCNGLYCFRSRSGFEICNPSTQEILYHPLPPSPPPRCLKSYGFGFDPLKNDYKVVQVVHENGNGNFARCMVYTLGANSWKDITVKSDLSNRLRHYSFTSLDGPAGMVNSGSGLYFSGALYWYFRRANTIMRFDLHTETFSLISLCFLCPLESMHSNTCFLTEWLGRLGLAFQTPRGGRVYTYRYMLKEYDLPEFLPQHQGVIPNIEVWKKLIVVLPRVPFSKVRVLGGKSTLLYWFTAQGCLSLYSPESCHYWFSDTGCETVENFPLPTGVKYPSICEYKFSHHIENPLSLKEFMLTLRQGLSLIRCTKGETMVQVKSVSSL